MTIELLRVLAIGDDQPANLEAPSLDRETHLRLFGQMLACRLLDEKLLTLQRQGRIAFHGPISGQEAASIGSSFALEDRDWIFPALREGPALLMRGFPLEKYLGQMIGNAADVSKGRQMPCHFSSREHRFVSLSSVIGTQIPQAVGAAWAAKIRGDDVVVAGYMGDGATSSTEFHAAMTFAAAGRAPCVLFCQNNQWAISVPFSAQTASDGVAVKAAGYGMEGVAVDGNDVLAVFAVTKRAADRARAGEGPTLIEAVTYRRGGHSSSDDPTRYRDEDAIAPWLLVDPLTRYRDWLGEHFDLDPSEEEEMSQRERERMEAAIKAAEAAPAVEAASLFEDVLSVMPTELERQMNARLSSSTSGAAAGEFPI